MPSFSHPPNWGIRLVLQTAALKLTHSLFSWRTRRMILLSSLYGSLTKPVQPDIRHAVGLAKVLNLTNDYRTMQLPVAINSVIWYHTDRDFVTVKKRQLCLQDLIKPDLTKEECQALVLHIVQQTPKVLRYAKTSQMVYDIQCLRDYIRSFTPPKFA